MRYIIMILASLIVLTGCAPKEMKSTVKGWGNDIHNAFEGSKDKSGE